jgi:hypothetical protein
MESQVLLTNGIQKADAGQRKMSNFQNAYLVVILYNHEFVT